MDAETSESKEVVGRLQSLENSEGVIKPSTVLEDARDPKSPLHGKFEWDDSVAAESHRLHQARELIRQFHIIVRLEERVLKVHYYIPDPDKPERSEGYVPTVTVASDAERAKRVLNQEIQRALALMNRARNLSEYFGLEQETAAILKAMKILKGIL